MLIFTISDETEVQKTGVNNDIQEKIVCFQLFFHLPLFTAIKPRIRERIFFSSLYHQWMTNR